MRIGAERIQTRALLWNVDANNAYRWLDVFWRFEFRILLDAEIVGVYAGSRQMNKTSSLACTWESDFKGRRDRTEYETYQVTVLLGDGRRLKIL